MKRELTSAGLMFGVIFFWLLCWKWLLQPDGMPYAVHLFVAAWVWFCFFQHVLNAWRMR